MKKRIKMASAALAVFLALTVIMTGCGTKETASDTAGQTSTASAAANSSVAEDPNKIDTSEAVELTMWLIGDAQPDAEKAFEELNKLAKRDINATVKVQYTTWTDYKQKYNLLFSSGEEFDLASCYAWTDYVSLANKKLFREITIDELNKYTPDIVKAIPPEFLEDAKVNGKIYMIPNNNFNAQGEVVAIRGDLREKYNLEVKTPDDYYNYITTVAQNEKNMVGFNGQLTVTLQQLLFANRYGYYFPTTNCQYSIVYKADDKTGKLYKITDVPEYKEFVTQMRTLYDAGAINKDILSSKANADEAFKAGKAASMVQALDAVQGAVNTISTEHPEWKPEIIDLLPDYVPPFALHQEGMVIPNSSKHPERAMMLDNLIMTNKDYQYLVLYGIQGTHYQLDNGKYKGLEGNKNFGFEGNVPWGYWNDALRLRDINKTDWYYDTYAKWAKAALVDPNPVAKISFDETNIKTEIAAVNSVASTALKGLTTGGLDPAKDFDEVNKKLVDAGIDKIIAEMQKQIDAKVK